jgi:hypothetical protein
LAAVGWGSKEGQQTKPQMYGFPMQTLEGLELVDWQAMHETKA